MTPMKMVKTQVYLPADELEALHRLARRRRRKVAELVREAIRATWLRGSGSGPIDLWRGDLNGTSAEHEAAFAG